MTLKQKMTLKQLIKKNIPKPIPSPLLLWARTPIIPIQLSLTTYAAIMDEVVWP